MEPDHDDSLWESASLEKPDLEDGLDGRDWDAAARVEQLVAERADRSPSLREEPLIGEVREGEEGSDQGKIVGNPEGDARYFHEQHYDDCAMVACGSVLEKQTGKPFNEEALLQQGKEMGVCDETGGVNGPRDMVRFLEANGVSAAERKNVSLEDLEGEIREGNDVIAVVNAERLWGNPDAYPGGNHAVWVTGVERDTAGNLQAVYVNDSAVGPAQRHTAADFQEALRLGGQNVVVARRRR